MKFLSDNVISFLSIMWQKRFYCSKANLDKSKMEVRCANDRNL